MPQLRFATCTPVAFHANEYFFSRDTGLICRSLQKLGADCRVIMPLPAHADDLPCPDVVRVSPNRLRSAQWWRSQGLDAVVLYSWGDPRYTLVARAIRRAGIRLIIHFDSSGELHEHLQRSSNRAINQAKDYLINRLRALHLGYADYITTPAPCIGSFRNDSAYGERIAARCVEFPTPVNSCFRYDGGSKLPRIICTGSWQLPVKRAGMLMRTLELLLDRHPGAAVDICGRVTDEMLNWHTGLAHQDRVTLHGMCNHEQLAALNNRASIALCTSESEGSHGASAEALCCGCSVVCPPRPLLRVVQWYTQQNSGTVAAQDTPEALCNALVQELEHWQLGTRNAAGIATAWQPCFGVESLLKLVR